MDTPVTPVPPRPSRRPANSNYSSGPCAKRPGWSVEALQSALVGRSHRAKIGKARLMQAIELTREVLQVPSDYQVAIVPGSDTGATEMALWSLLGARPVDMLAWESFGHGWVTDVVKQLKLPNVRVLKADYGKLPDLSQVDPGHDVVFTWNGTTSGVQVPNGDWIAADREGLTICDAPAAAFAQKLPFDKLDVTTFSWQKALGGEAAHGMIILSPRAVERLESYTPPWPVPKVFRLTKNGKLNTGPFLGSTINTPSMLCVEDYIDALKWAKSIGGLNALVAKADGNCKVVSDWAKRTAWIDFLAEDPATRSNTAVCLRIVDPAVTELDADRHDAFVRSLTARLDAEDVAHDIMSHRDAPPHVRIWAGPTISPDDLAIVTEWLEWSYAAEKAALTQAA